MSLFNLVFSIYASCFPCSYKGLLGLLRFSLINNDALPFRCFAESPASAAGFVVKRALIGRLLYNREGFELFLQLPVDSGRYSPIMRALLLRHT